MFVIYLIDVCCFFTNVNFLDFIHRYYSFIKNKICMVFANLSRDWSCSRRCCTKF